MLKTMYLVVLLCHNLAVWRRQGNSFDQATISLGFNIIGLRHPLDKNRYEARHEKTCLMPNANNKGADQHAHLRSLVSTFVVRCRRDNIIPIVVISKF